MLSTVNLELLRLTAYSPFVGYSDVIVLVRTQAVLGRSRTP